MSPWALVLVFAVGFAGPLIGRLKGFKDTPLASMPRNDWLAIAIGLALVLLALNKHGGQGSLLLALIPVIWILIIDRSFLTAESGKSSSATKPKESKDSSISSAPALINAKPSEAIENLQESTPDNTTSMPPLAGEALLSKIKEIGDANKSDLVRACGYVGQRADGSERLNFTAFYEALLEAKGVNRSAEDDDEEENEESTPPEQSIDLPAEWKELDNSEIVERLKNCPDLNSEILSALAGSDEWVVRQAVAWHDNTPASILETLANDDDSDVQQAVKERSLPLDWRFMTQDEKVEALQSDEISTNIIETLASSENWSLRQAVAWSPSTPDSVLARLRDDDDNDVKFAASEGRILPVEWRFLSVSDKKERLAEQPVPKDILAVLAVDPRDRDVRWAVALHSGTPEELLSKLAEDDDANVQSGVRERELPDQWKSLDDDDRVAALREPGVPEAVLMILARSGNWQIREAIGLSPAAPDAILELLLNDEDSDVQSAVLQRNLPEEWKGLDEDQTVERLNESTVDASILEILAKSGRWSVRQAVAQMESANARVNEAKAQFFPTLSLTGLFGGVSTSLTDLLSGQGARVASLGPNVLLPLYSGGALAGNRDAALARLDQSIISYRKAVLTALGEVADALMAYSSSAEVLSIQGERVTASREVQRLAEMRYSAGTTGFVEVLDAQRQLLSAETDEVQSLLERRLALVRLYLALGGGWSPPAN